MLKEKFLHYLSAERNYSAATVSGYDYALSKFAVYMEQQGITTDWLKVETGDIREWMTEEMSKGCSTSSINTWLSAMRSFYKFLLAYGYASTDPTRRLEGPKKKKALPYYIKEGEIDSLLDKTKFPDNYEGTRDRTILLTFYSTGIRLAELVGLNIEDVDLEKMSLKVTGKRNKQRIIPFGIEMKNDMMNYLNVRNHAKDDNHALFLGHNGGRIERSVVEERVKFY